MVMITYNHNNLGQRNELKQKNTLTTIYLVKSPIVSRPCSFVFALPLKTSRSLPDAELPFLALVPTETLQIQMILSVNIMQFITGLMATRVSKKEHNNWNSGVHTVVNMLSFSLYLFCNVL